MSVEREALFAAYLDARYRALLGQAYLLTGSRTAAADLVQGALVAVYARLGTVAADRLDAYVRRALLNTFLSSRRRHWNREQPTETLPERIDRSDLDRVEDRERLAVALRQLPARQRAAVVLRFYEDYSERDTAEALGCRPGTAKALVSRGLARLRELVTDDLDIPEGSHHAADGA